MAKNDVIFTAVNYLILLILGGSLLLYGCDTNDECEGSSTCVNGFFQSIAGCECFCFNEWEGEECDVCRLENADCPDNGFANLEECRCECDPTWCGDDCATPVRVCLNGGTWNPFSCSCDCPEGWAGEICDSMI